MYVQNHRLSLSLPQVVAEPYTSKISNHPEVPFGQLTDYMSPHDLSLLHYMMNSPFWRQILRLQTGWSPIPRDDRRYWNTPVMERANGFGPHFVDPRTKGPTLQEILNENAPAPVIRQGYGVGIVDPRTATVNSDSKLRVFDDVQNNDQHKFDPFVEIRKPVDFHNNDPIVHTVETNKKGKTQEPKQVSKNLLTNSKAASKVIKPITKISNTSMKDIVNNPDENIEQRSAIQLTNQGTNDAMTVKPNAVQKQIVYESVNGPVDIESKPKLQHQISSHPLEAEKRYRAGIIDPRISVKSDMKAIIRKSVQVPLIPLVNLADKPTIEKENDNFVQNIKIKPGDTFKSPVPLPSDVLLDTQQGNVPLQDQSHMQMPVNLENNGQPTPDTSNIGNIPGDNSASGTSEIERKPYLGKTFKSGIIDPRTI